MKPTAKQLLQNLEGLKVMIELYGDSELELRDKATLANAVAWSVEQIRRKYEITSAFYFPAEGKANTLYEERYSDNLWK